MEKLASFLKDNKPVKILDVGTGGGNFIGLINSLYNDFEEIIGIDSLEIAVSSASKNFQEDDRVSFTLMDAHNLDFEDGLFDLVCLSNSLHHLDDKETILGEMARVLKPGGYILIAEMINNDLDERQISHLKVHHFAAKIDRLRGEVHNDTYSDVEIVEVINHNSDLNVGESWHLSYERQKENSDEDIAWLVGTLDRLTSRVEDEDTKEELLLEAEEIKEYIRKNGFDSCTTLVAVMQK